MEGEGVLGLEEKITVSKALAESSNFREYKTKLQIPPRYSRPVVSIWDLSPPAQIQMPSQLKNTQTSHLINVSLIASNNLPINMEPP